MTQLSEALRAAKALIDTPEKWLRNKMMAGQKCCAMGAVARVSKHNILSDTPVRSVPAMKAITKELPKGFFDVPVFNDHPDTTHADIMALFDRAIATASASE